jgi:uncharacterized protein YdeI (YjbR/CyaY-like superfamily)
VSAAKKAAAPTGRAAPLTVAPNKPRHFASAKAFGAWLDRHHEHAPELWVGFWKKGTGKPSVDWPQAVREALRVGWIDGIRKSLGDEAYVIRFVPRREGSVWSAINIRIAEELIAEGRMLPAGQRAFEDRHSHPSSGYRIAERSERLPAGMEKPLHANRAAWSFWQAQPPGYRRSAVHWVTSAKRDDTQARRLAQLIADSAAGRRIGALTRQASKG